MIHRNADDRRSAVEALTLQYVLGIISEAVFQVSLRAHVDADEVRHLTILNQAAHRNSTPYRKGDVT